MLSDYRIEYQTNGHPKLFEFYLFVNPLGRKCYYSEHEVKKSIEMISSKVDLHVMCFHNQRIVTDFIKQLDIKLTDLNARNKIYRIVYHASLAFKAASMQGKRKGRIFLMKMQQQIDGDIDLYNDEFIQRIAKDVGLDVEVFMEDIESDYVRELYLTDQKIATSMNVVATPSLVIFEHTGSDVGYVMEGNLTKDNILAQLDEIIEGELNHSKKTSNKRIRLL